MSDHPVDTLTFSGQSSCVYRILYLLSYLSTLDITLSIKPLLFLSAPACPLPHLRRTTPPCLFPTCLLLLPGRIWGRGPLGLQRYMTGSCLQGLLSWNP